ncbi:cyclase family protein [Fimbriimonas ginsengisoli]|uniref:Kynurenine formamidase n=1 Tax=Fimbriimonas ginsengisoli Gsoil 348 TaxID=661478 RepID=A0A068NXK5_FIMGI|nr:cyclase family protein [Fimbriimonas ginsengisoli]AIE86369.1 cyclase family protein [Fimbriimonas ginsengisoli Gsoil 348]
MEFDGIIDISRTITAESVVYPGDPRLEMSPFLSIGEESPCNVTRLGWITHFLTHVDPPLHFVAGGLSVAEMSLDSFCGQAVVVHAHGAVIEPADLPMAEEIRGRCILFRTSNSDRWDPRTFIEDHVYVAHETALSLVEMGAKLVGIDYLSPDRFGDEEYPVHRTLLGAGIPILEGIDLLQVAPGRYSLFALPLKIAEGDGSPVRAILLPFK